MALSQLATDYVYAAFTNLDAANEIYTVLNTASPFSSTEAGYLDGSVAGTGAANKCLVLGASGNVTLVDGSTVTLNATTGVKIGATSDKIGFLGATPAVRQTAYTQTYSTADRTHAAPTAATLTVTDGAGTNDNTIGAITADASVIAAVQEIVDEINKLIADVADVKQLANSIVDDLQTFGLVG